MKQVYITFIALIFSITLYAQGIAVQGIARDNDNSAISDENMVFTFSIVETNNTELYKETETIRTDNFGIFSHIVSTGSPQGNTVFANIDFSKQGLKMKVSVNYDGTAIEVYDQPFQYTAYAKYAEKAKTAEDGVPPGTVVAFMGDDDKIPTGWVKCIGQDITDGIQYAALRAVIGNTIPDLRARFLRGQGQSSNIDIRIYDETTSVRQYLNQTIVGHKHGVSLTTNTTGNHNHTTSLKTDNISTDGGGTRAYAYDIEGNNAYPTRTPTTSTNGNHNHTVNGDTGDVGVIQNGGVNLASRGEENRPWTVVVNYIIKL
jgi:hypothetical protein